jgi:hypothetical protein
MGPNEQSVHNAMAGLNIAPESGAIDALPPLQDIPIAPTGKQMDTSFLNQEWDDNWDDTRKELYYQVHVMGIRPTPESLAQDATQIMDAERKRAATMQDEQMKAQREREAQAQDPAGQADLAAKQGEFQQNYLQELQYQRHIATLNNPKATRAERATAINAIDGLAASIGQRMIKGTSTAAVADAKRLVGTVSSRVPVVGINVQEYNPAADYGPQLETMLGGSQERMGVLRQQMEAAGIPLPEAKQMEEAVKNPPAPNLFELSVQKLGVKGADGSQVMLNGAPVIRRKDGKMFKAMPNGKGVELTAEEISQLGL